MKNIVVLDFGGTAAVIAARKLRGARVFSRIVDANAVSMDVLTGDTAGIVIAGNDERDADSWSKLPTELMQAGVPVLALGNAACVVLSRMGGSVNEGMLYRQAALAEFSQCALFENVPMSERFFVDGRALGMGEDWQEIGALKNGMTVAFAHKQLPVFGMQFDLEPNDPDGWSILNNFATAICGCEPEWEMERFCEDKIRELRNVEGETLIAISGGVDSAVCAELMRRAVGDRLHCVFIDTGLMRKGEMEDVRDLFANQLRMKLEIVDAKDRVWQALRGVSSAQEKRIIIRSALYDVLMEEAERIGNIENVVQHSGARIM